MLLLSGVVHFAMNGKDIGVNIAEIPKQGPLPACYGFIIGVLPEKSTYKTQNIIMT
jgi:hypothetical protein